MIRIETEIFLSHSPEKVWTALLDFENYAQWNPFVFDAKLAKPNLGEHKGALVFIKVNAPGGKTINGNPKTYNFKVYLNIFETNKMLAWASKPLFPWIFSGVHYFRLTPSGDGTLLTHGETFNGIIAELMRKHIGNNFPKGYEKMNVALARWLDSKI